MTHNLWAQCATRTLHYTVLFEQPMFVPGSLSAYSGGSTLCSVYCVVHCAKACVVTLLISNGYLASNCVIWAFSIYNASELDRFLEDWNFETVQVWNLSCLNFQQVRAGPALYFLIIETTRLNMLNLHSSTPPDKTWCCNVFMELVSGLQFTQTNIEGAVLVLVLVELCIWKYVLNLLYICWLCWIWFVTNIFYTKR